MQEQVRPTRREVRQRLWNPPNGRASSELEVVSDAAIMREAIARMKQERKVSIHEARVAATVEAIRRQREKWREAELDWIRRINSLGVTTRAILDYCCERYKIAPNAVLSVRRNADICHVRHIIAYLCCELTTKSLPEIGRDLGGRNHSTIFHSREQMKARVAANKFFAAEIEDIKRTLGAEAPATPDRKGEE